MGLLRLHRWDDPPFVPAPLTAEEQERRARETIERQQSEANEAATKAMFVAALDKYRREDAKRRQTES